MNIASKFAFRRLPDRISFARLSVARKGLILVAVPLLFHLLFVLIVELKRASLEVDAQHVETEEDFRKHLAEGNVDVILADYSLPTFDGGSALQIARAIAPEVPFIFVSGSIGEERAVNALRDGARDYILKDRMSRLGPAVKRALDERKELDIRREAQEALRESEARFRSVAELAGDAILLTEGANKIAFANERAAWMFGYRAEELVGRDKVTLLARDVRDDHERAIESIRIGDDSQTSLRRETTGLRRDGTKFPLEMSVSSWRRDGQLLHDDSPRRERARRQRRAPPRGTAARAHRQLGVRPGHETGDLVGGGLCDPRSRSTARVSIGRPFRIDGPS